MPSCASQGAMATGECGREGPGSSSANCVKVEPTGEGLHMTSRDIRDDRLMAAATYFIGSRERRSHFFSEAHKASDGPLRSALARDLMQERGKDANGHRFPDLEEEEALYIAGWAELAAMHLSPIKDHKEKDAALTNLLTKARSGDRDEPKIVGG